MSNIILLNPTVQHAQEVADICKPLHTLNITYFGHILVDNKGELSALGSSPEFFEHYFNNGYYNSDIHMAKDNRLGTHVIWDEIERCGRSEKMHSEAAQFGVQHTFTIIEKDNRGSHYYHFANNSPSKFINQTYLANIDLLSLFIQHFNENVKQSKSLSMAYDLKFSIDRENGDYSIKDSEQIVITDEIRSDFIQSLTIDPTSNALSRLTHQLCNKKIRLSKRETEVLLHLIRGKSARSIAEMLKISKRTVESFIEMIKIKMNVSSKSEVVGTLVDCLF